MIAMTIVARKADLPRLSGLTLLTGQGRATIMIGMDMLMHELERIRQERGWSDRRMSRELGVSEAVYGHLKAGRMGAGRKVLRGITRAFPWLDVKFYIAQDVGPRQRDGDKGGQ